MVLIIHTSAIFSFLKQLHVLLLVQTSRDVTVLSFNWNGEFLQHFWMTEYKLLNVVKVMLETLKNIAAIWCQTVL